MPPSGSVPAPSGDDVDASVVKAKEGVESVKVSGIKAI